MMTIVTKTLIAIGVCFIVFGLTYEVFSRFNLPLGKLPGDINITSKNLSFHFPLVTSLLLSVIGTLALYIYQSLHK